MPPKHQYFPPVHREGSVWVIASAIIAAAFWWLGLGFLAFLVGMFAAFCAYFFRDPRRIVPEGDGILVAPADGRIDDISHVSPPSELAMGDDDMLRISIFLSVLDVHINRAPVDGVVQKIAYARGSFRNAASAEASTVNERNMMAIATDDDEVIGVVQIAGLIARRILCWSGEGDRLEAGERFGMIRFGSRTDVYVPLSYAPQVALGQRTIGGETIIARKGVEALKVRQNHGQNSL
ncbi:MAG: phosphatidylserine decarboxylase [Pseudomonadota bacterium]